MTQEEFIKVLDEKGYSYKIKGDSIVVTHKGEVDLNYIPSLPPVLKFKNRGYVSLKSLTSLHPGVWFVNGGHVFLESLTSISPGVEFRNKGIVYLPSLIDGQFNKWEGNIRGIDDRRLMHLMISKGLLER